MGGSNEPQKSCDEARVSFKRCKYPEDVKDGLMSRCFMTGDRCPHQKEIMANKLARHKAGKILVFVVMAFTPITDTLYHWMLKDLIKSAQGQFFLQGEEDEDPADQEITGDEQLEIIRGSDNIHSSHIICESICSKIQEADLVVVDLSYQNPNVFYEFGLAVALGKKILPICYRERYYMSDGKSGKDIRLFPWKQTLFEFFSLNAQEGSKRKPTPQGDGQPQQNPGENSALKLYVDGDEFFTRFPYTDEPGDKKTSGAKNSEVGASLRLAFNHSLKVTDNLLIYDPKQPVQARRTQLGTKINAFSAIVDKITRGARPILDPAVQDMEASRLLASEERSVAGMRLRGDRMLLLCSEEPILTCDKDKKGSQVQYSFGDIGRLAINQASYAIESGNKSAGSHGLERSMWYYIYNCTEVQSIEYPIYVDTVIEKRYPELNFLLDQGRQLAVDSAEPWSFTYLDVILAKAQHCHTAFIDMRGNRIQSLFWMGVFHGRGRFVIPIHYTDDSQKNAVPSDRTIVDIAGLWNAYFSNSALEAFSADNKNVLSGFYEKAGHLNAVHKSGFLRALGTWMTYDKTQKTGVEPPKAMLSFAQKLELERHYRQMFWDVMLAHDDVALYPSAYTDAAQGPKATISNWDYNAIARLDRFSNQRSGAFRTVLEDTLSYTKSEAERKAAAADARNVITLGDRGVNKRTHKELAGYEAQTFRLRKCDLALAQPEAPPDLAGCKTCSKRPANQACCSKPESVRGFESGGFAHLRKEGVRTEWMGSFVTPQQVSMRSAKLVKLYGQMVILRHSDSRFSVLLEGASGPATYALADLLSENTVMEPIQSEEARRQADAEAQENASPEGGEKLLLFYTLQKQMLCACWAKLLEIKESEVKKEVKKGKQNIEYLEEVFSPAADYLMLCLCDRFLPVASRRFMEDLDARLRLFLEQFQRDIQQAEIEINDENLENLFTTIRNIFKCWLLWFSELHGVAILIKSDMKADESTEDDKLRDNRYPESIKIAEGEHGEWFHIIHGHTG